MTDEPAPMWKRILAWQAKPARESASCDSATGGPVLATPIDTPNPAFIADQRSGVGVQRELAKLMW
jgi:hypothetical protein